MLKRNAKTLFLIIAIILLVACSTSTKNSSPEKLIQNYLEALHKIDYEAIWNMIPKAIQDYAIDAKIIKDKDSGVKFVYETIKKNLALNELALASSNEYKYCIINRETIAPEKIAYIQSSLQDLNIELEIQDVAFYDIVVVTEKAQKDIEIFMVKVANEWYLTTGDGNDTLLGIY